MTFKSLSKRVAENTFVFLAFFISASQTSFLTSICGILDGEMVVVNNSLFLVKYSFLSCAIYYITLEYISHFKNIPIEVCILNSAFFVLLSTFFEWGFLSYFTIKKSVDNMEVVLGLLMLYTFIFISGIICDIKKSICEIFNIM